MLAYVKEAPEGIDVTVPNAARMYDYYLGGKDNFAADREAAEKVLTLVPQLRQSVVENRRFLERVIRFLAAEGIDQFIDIGAGLPTVNPVHEVAREISPDARVCYVDYDPVVVSHGKALLRVPDHSIMVRADLRKPRELLADPLVTEFLDLTRPVAVLLIAVLHFVADEDDPYQIVADLRDALAPGSYIALVHLSGDFVASDAGRQATEIYRQASADIYHRDRAEILRLFDGFDLVPPGLVPKHEWRPDGGDPGYRTGNVSWGGVARKP
jgi:O-methyltransferase involved in polyketide biosynthesis